mmetsp:Transcript_107556/g.131230  ORF Transcript_107556/g.131230 Transcript_107556/m.131230 type:complete len:272 (-) Transcript_107556:669-1484(-)
MSSTGTLQAGYGNGGINSMLQFDKLNEKLSNSIKNLEFTKEMLKQLGDNEKQSGKIILQLITKKNKSLRFSVVDTAIQSYWKKRASSRIKFAESIQQTVIPNLELFLNQCRSIKRNLCRENDKIQKNFLNISRELSKQKNICEREWQSLGNIIAKNERNIKSGKKEKDILTYQNRCKQAFKKLESMLNSLNEYEQLNHKHTIELGKLLHKSQSYAAERLIGHYNYCLSEIKYLKNFQERNKPIVQGKAPPIEDVLWRWISYPKKSSIIFTM